MSLVGEAASPVVDRDAPAALQAERMRSGDDESHELVSTVSVASDETAVDLDRVDWTAVPPAGNHHIDATERPDVNASLAGSCTYRLAPNEVACSSSRQDRDDRVI
jgi:hypothetical protein